MTWALSIGFACVTACAPLPAGDYPTREACLEAGHHVVVTEIITGGEGSPEPNEIICKGPNGEIVRERGPWSVL